MKRNIKARVTSNDFKRCLEVYDQCGIVYDEGADKRLREKFSHYRLIIASDIRRSYETAMMLSPEGNVSTGEVFRKIKDKFMTIPL